MPSILKRSIGTILLGGLAFGASCTSDPAVSRESLPVTDAEPAQPQGKPHAILETDKGPIEIELLPELAPKTVENFVELAELGFYRRTSFHRIMPGRMIQGGDPNSKDNDPYNDGTGGSGRLIPAEFSDTPFERGTVAMARKADNPDSASSQFFIVLERMPGWDGEYTVFGRVVAGIESVDEISQVPLSKQPRLEDHPAGKVFIKEIRIEYRQPDGV